MRIFRHGALVAAGQWRLQADTARGLHRLDAASPRVLVMFQTHCYDSWLGSAARKTQFFAYSQLGGTLPAPLFLFLAGVSVALATDRSWQHGIAPGRIARSTMWRGMEVLDFGLLFRLQEFLLGQPWAPWTDLLRVDVLNIIGLSIVFLGVLIGGVSWLSSSSQEENTSALPPALRVRTPLWPRCWPGSQSLWPRRFCGQPTAHAGCLVSRSRVPAACISC